MSLPAYYYFTKQDEWKAYLQNLVKTNDSACRRAIVQIDNWQTELERQQGESTEENGVGWTKYDAREMGLLAKKIRRGEELTRAEMAKSRNKMQKYWKQLMDISKRNLEKVLQQQSAEAEEYARAQYEARREHFEEALEVIRRCGEDGVPCEYGICDECPLARGYQMRMEGI